MTNSSDNRAIAKAYNMICEAEVSPEYASVGRDDAMRVPRVRMSSSPSACPFCGGKCSVGYLSNHNAYVRCTECTYCSGDYVDMETAVRSHNRVAHVLKRTAALGVDESMNPLHEVTNRRRERGERNRTEEKSFDRFSDSVRRLSTATNGDYAHLPLSVLGDIGKNGVNFSAVGLCDGDWRILSPIGGDEGMSDGFSWVLSDGKGNFIENVDHDVGLEMIRNSKDKFFCLNGIDVMA